MDNLCYWLVVEPTPLKNMSSSIGMIVPNIWKNKIHVPNHQLGGMIIVTIRLLGSHDDSTRNVDKWAGLHVQKKHHPTTLGTSSPIPEGDEGSFPSPVDTQKKQNHRRSNYH